MLSFTHRLLIVRNNVIQLIFESYYRPTTTYRIMYVFYCYVTAANVR